MGFPRQEYWSGLPFPSSVDLPDIGVELMSPALAGGFFITEQPGKPNSPRYLFWKIFSSWSIVDLQGCVNFYCIAKLFSYICMYIRLHILFHYGLAQDIEYSSSCYIVGPCCLPTLCICWSWTPSPSLPKSPSCLVTTGLFSVSADLFHSSTHLCHIWDSICKWYHMVFVYFT